MSVLVCNRYISRLLCATVIVFFASRSVWSVDPTADRQSIGRLQYDFGIVDSKTKREHTFVLANGSDQDWKIVGGHVTCGCISLSALPEVIPAGKTASVRVSLDPHDQEGRFGQKAYLFINNPAHSMFELSVIATVPGAWFRPSTVLFNSRVSLENHRDVKLSIAGLGKAKINELKTSNRAITAELLTAATGRAELSKVGTDAYEGMVRVTFDSGEFPSGRISETVTAVTDIDNVAATLHLQGHGGRTVVVEPGSAFFGTLQPGVSANRHCVVESGASMQGVVCTVEFSEFAEQTTDAVSAEVTTDASQRTTVSISVRASEDARPRAVLGRVRGVVPSNKEVFSIPFAGYVASKTPRGSN